MQAINVAENGEGRQPKTKMDKKLIINKQSELISTRKLPHELNNKDIDHLR